MKNQEAYKTMNIHEKINFRDDAVKFKDNVELIADFGIKMFCLVEKVKLTEEENKTIKNGVNKFLGLDKSVYKFKKLI